MLVARERRLPERCAGGLRCHGGATGAGTPSPRRVLTGRRRLADGVAAEQRPSLHARLPIAAVPPSTVGRREGAGFGVLVLLARRGDAQRPRARREVALALAPGRRLQRWLHEARPDLRPLPSDGQHRHPPLAVASERPRLGVIRRRPRMQRPPAWARRQGYLRARGCWRTVLHAAGIAGSPLGSHRPRQLQNAAAVADPPLHAAGFSKAGRPWRGMADDHPCLVRGSQWKRNSRSFET